MTMEAAIKQAGRCLNPPLQAFVSAGFAAVFQAGWLYPDAFIHTRGRGV